MRAFFLPKKRDRVFMGEREREGNGREGSRLWRSEYGHSATAIAGHARPKVTQYLMGQLGWVSQAQQAQYLTRKQINKSRNKLQAQNLH